jgi:nucleotide-binding universal stress UspA family protein
VAARLARDLGSRALLVHVQEEQRRPRLAPRIPRPRRSWRRRRLLKATARDCCFPPDVRVRLKRGDPTKELLATASEEDAELLVVASGGLGTASPMLLGGTASALMQTAPCPVVVVPARSVTPLDAESMREVVCALEGEAEDAAVLGLAADLAERLGSELHVVSRHGEPNAPEGLGIDVEVHLAGTEPLPEAVKRVADRARAGLAVVGAPHYSQPVSGLDVPLAIALAADGDTAVIVLTNAAKLHLGSGHYELAARAG